MAIAHGPMLSLSASGGLAKTLMYRTRGGKTSVGKWVQPPNPDTAAQRSIRLMNKMLGAKWSAISAPDQNTWRPNAEYLRIAPYHRYLSFNMQRWIRRQAPSQVEGAPEDDVAPAPFILFASPGVHNDLVLTCVCTQNDLWTTFFYELPTPSLPFTRTDLITFPFYEVGNVAATSLPIPAPGNHYYAAQQCSKHGLWSNIIGPITYVQP